MHLDSWEMSHGPRQHCGPERPTTGSTSGTFADRFDTRPGCSPTSARSATGRSGIAHGAARRATTRSASPTFLIGGWYDGYRDSIPRMLEHAEGAGQGDHRAPGTTPIPTTPYPKPQIEWRREAVRWFDHWLKGRGHRASSRSRDSPCTCAVGIRPARVSRTRRASGATRTAGRIARIRERVLVSAAEPHARCARRRARDDALSYVTSRPSVIEAGGPGHVVGRRRARPAAARTHSASSTTRDAARGRPRDPGPAACARSGRGGCAARANWFARVSDVAPDGTVTQVAGAGMNGATANPRASPKALVPGEAFRARDRDALHVLGLPEGPPHPARGQQRPVADALADAGADDDGATRLGASRLTLAGRAVRRASGAGLSAARAGSGICRLRDDRRRHDLGLWRDFLGGPQSARPASSSRRRRTTAERDSRGATEQDLRDNPLRDQGRRAGRCQGARHAPHGSRTAGPKARLGRRAQLPQRPREFLLQLPPAADREMCKPVREKTWNQTIPRDYQ